MKIFARLAAVALFGVLAGCTGGGTPLASLNAQPVSGLGGVWRLDASPEPPSTVLQLTGGDLFVHSECLSFHGTWVARGGFFLGDVETEDLPNLHPGCTSYPPGGPPTWLKAVSSYERSGDGWILRAADGAAVATLASGGAVPANVQPNFAELSSGGEPKPFFEERARLNTTVPVPLPAGLTPATPDSVLGHWQNETDNGRCASAFVDFGSDHTWTGNDGEDRVKGSWALGADGIAVGNAKDHVLGSCAGPTAPDGVMFRVARMGFDGEVLALFDPAGQPLARYTRA